MIGTDLFDIFSIHPDFSNYSETISTNQATFIKKMVRIGYSTSDLLANPKWFLNGSVMSTMDIIPWIIDTDINPVLIGFLNLMGKENPLPAAIPISFLKTCSRGHRIPWEPIKATPPGRQHYDARIEVTTKGPPPAGTATARSTGLTLQDLVVKITYTTGFGEVMQKRFNEMLRFNAERLVTIHGESSSHTVPMKSLQHQLLLYV